MKVGPFERNLTSVDDVAAVRGTGALLGRIMRRSGQLHFDAQFDAKREPDERAAAVDLLVSGLADKSVLDVGCWTGGLLAGMKQMGAREIVGADIAGPWLDELSRWLPEATVVRITEIAALDSSLNGRFDVVCLLETLEHVPRGSEPSVLIRLHDTLAPDGRLVLSTPAAGLPALFDPAWTLAGHRHYTRKRLEQLAADANLRVLRVCYSGEARDHAATLALYLTKYVPLLRRVPWLQQMRDAKSATKLRARHRMAPMSIWMCLERDR